ncbi:MAG: hypothetical protein JOY66_16155 [Acetobacteraceae bacterium]|nr:hypothetical protein [Acetobacteraceae bacterium]
MNGDRIVIPQRQPDTIDDPLRAVLRARRTTLVEPPGSGPKGAPIKRRPTAVSATAVTPAPEPRR